MRPVHPSQTSSDTSVKTDPRFRIQPLTNIGEAISKPPPDRTSFGSGAYFVTAGAAGRRSVFQTEKMARLFIDTIYLYRREHKFLIHRFVVMRDHVHLLVSPLEADLPRSLQLIKGGFSYRAKKELGVSFEIWERGYVDHRIRDANDYRRHIEYIDQNPVRAGFVIETDKYPYSSAHPGFELDACPQGLKPRE